MKLSLGDRLRLRRGLDDHVLRGLPVLVLMPHSRCNCRCVMCDIWKANANGRELTGEDLAPHLESLRKLRVRWVVLSGGEALMHRNLWQFCGGLRGLRAKISLLSTGLLMKRFAREIVDSIDDVIVSLDGSPATHDAIRNIPRAFERLSEGVQAVRGLNEKYRITARCVVQKQNFHDIVQTVKTAQSLGLNQISFLAADVSTEAFNRPDGWTSQQVDTVALAPDEADELQQTLESNEEFFRELHADGAIAESFQRLLRIPAYYSALAARNAFPEVGCNAPWVSAVVEADGGIRPCFFLPAYGNLGDGDFAQTVNSPRAVEFRKNLDVSANDICQRCVCSLKL